MILRLNMGPPLELKVKVKKPNPNGFWNTSSRPTSAISFRKIGLVKYVKQIRGCSQSSFVTNKQNIFLNTIVFSSGEKSNARVHTETRKSS